MNAIELLLSAGDTVEKVHQSAWYVLLRDSDFLAELGLASSYGQRPGWEPDGGVFDLKVETADGPVWIELKVDAGLGDGQLRKQLAHGREGQIVYALLGFADIRSRPWLTDKITSGGAKVVGRKDVHAAALAVADSDREAGVRELARAYAGLIDGLRRRGEDFRAVEPERWSWAHGPYFFEALRADCPEMAKAIVEYVPNHTGGFEACHWGWVGVGEGVDCYPQWQGARLCFKISVAEDGKRSPLRDVAVAFLEGQSIAGQKVERPRPLGWGRTMTVGFLDSLPVTDEAAWDELRRAVCEATEVTGRLADRLRRSIHGEPSA